MTIKTVAHKKKRAAIPLRRLFSESMSLIKQETNVRSEYCGTRFDMSIGFSLIRFIYSKCGAANAVVGLIMELGNISNSRMRQLKLINRNVVKWFKLHVSASALARKSRIGPKVGKLSTKLPLFTLLSRAASWKFSIAPLFIWQTWFCLRWNGCRDLWEEAESEALWVFAVPYMFTNQSIASM